MASPTSRQKAMLKKQGVSLAYLFGSQVNGLAGSLSDADIGVVFADVEKMDRHSLQTYDALHKLFSDMVPEGIEADIVFLDRAPITVQAKAATGQLLYARSPKDHYHYREQTMRRHADAQHFIDRRTNAIFARI